MRTSTYLHRIFYGIFLYMIKILLNTVNKKSKNYKKYSALIDDEDFDLVNKYNWQVDITANGTMYARTYQSIKMHILITGKRNIDHIDGNGLNNQKHNLRVATKQENAQNQRKCITTKTSIYKGVYLTKNIIKGKTYTRWYAQIGHNKKRIHIGSFKNETDAAKAYNQKALELFGEFAHLNEIN